jgi:hypothetical protein
MPARWIYCLRCEIEGLNVIPGTGNVIGLNVAKSYKQSKVTKVNR